MPDMSMGATDVLAPMLSPHGHLLLLPDIGAPALPSALQQRLADAFALGAGHGLLHLGAAEVGSVLPPAWTWWREFASRYVTALCATPEGGDVAAPEDPALEALIVGADPNLSHRADRILSR